MTEVLYFTSTCTSLIITHGHHMYVHEYLIEMKVLFEDGLSVMIFIEYTYLCNIFQDIQNYG